MSYFKAKMHQIRFRLRLSPRSRSEGRMGRKGKEKRKEEWKKGEKGKEGRGEKGPRGRKERGRGRVASWLVEDGRPCTVA